MLCQMLDQGDGRYDTDIGTLIHLCISASNSRYNFSI